MPDLDKFAGTRGEPFTMPIERGKVREFARATRAQHPAFLEDTNPTIPPTFLMTAVYWQEPRHFALGGLRLDIHRGLQAGQAFTFHGPPPRAGDQLTALQRVDSVEHKTGRRGGDLTFIAIVTEFRDPTGALRAESRTTLVQTSHAVGAGI
ncbi:MaoC family dehydratase N-terminal domain-containing protein [Nocardia vinacea]|uniref:MaoC family dehydratase N-terminal domain-containing protein n=1 Tax=Nocardia vinacea TaxID=96468 RepID=A0ABZ1YTM3_9NOCA|nr:MaoC family dehydratase N-terminal domain-containing protein [Nocardia vinacea]